MVIQIVQIVSETDASVSYFQFHHLAREETSGTNICMTLFPSYILLQIILAIYQWMWISEIIFFLNDKVFSRW